MFPPMLHVLVRMIFNMFNIMEEQLETKPLHRPEVKRYFKTFRISLWKYKSLITK
jgi:hypothetical protein